MQCGGGFVSLLCNSVTMISRSTLYPDGFWHLTLCLHCERNERLYLGHGFCLNGRKDKARTALA